MRNEIEQSRLKVSRETTPDKKARFGQFLTPSRTADFMAGLFPPAEGVCRLLDAGAGIGSLSAAFLDHWADGRLGFSSVELTAFEIDQSLHTLLKETFERFRCETLQTRILGEDFIHAAVESLASGFFAHELPRFSHVILNPPYKKISSSSQHRIALRRAGIETVNLYSAFVALAVALSEPGAQIVAIIPRSFCNGPYYRPFRDFILERSAIQHLHLFGSRTSAFRDDSVLQENIIIRLEVGVRQGPVQVSTSTDDSFADLVTSSFSFMRIVYPDDPERFIHVPHLPGQDFVTLPDDTRFSLADLGVQVSTGPVVDFRMRDHLRSLPGPDSAPLLYPCHFSDGATRWPVEGGKKPNAIAVNTDTEKWLYPSGYYCVVRRLSSKEEKHRIVASVVQPQVFGDVNRIGFENHLNVFHAGKQSLPAALAYGLALYLNTTAVDDDFRRFNGHTQVNATDLKLMKYPSRQQLMQMGSWAMEQENPSQAMIDEHFLAVSA